MTSGTTSGSRSRHAGRSDPAGRPVPPAVEVAPGDTLWSITAGLLPSVAPSDAVAAGWPLLYAANREVVGDDPDLLQPGQSLRIGPALARLVRESSAPLRPQPPDAGGHP
jgi:nucleoid-associated protein YgaU